MGWSLSWSLMQGCRGLFCVARDSYSLRILDCERELACVASQCRPPSHMHAPPPRTPHTHPTHPTHAHTPFFSGGVPARACLRRAAPRPSPGPVHRGWVRRPFHVLPRPERGHRTTSASVHRRASDGLGGWCTLVRSVRALCGVEFLMIDAARYCLECMFSDFRQRASTKETTWGGGRPTAPGRSRRPSPFKSPSAPCLALPYLPPPSRWRPVRVRLGPPAPRTAAAAWRRRCLAQR